jgi:exo-1,4-beta-D-glucosaminidase
MPPSIRIFQINGKNILIRGAGYSFDMLLRSSPERQEAELRYVRDMNLNTIRFEGKLEDDHFFDLMDEMGILAMPGWCCCDQWERWKAWKRRGRTDGRGVATRPDPAVGAPPVSVHLPLRERSYAPPPQIEKAILYRSLKESDWPNPAVASAGELHHDCSVRPE